MIKNPNILKQGSTESSSVIKALEEKKLDMVLLAKLSRLDCMRGHKFITQADIKLARKIGVQENVFKPRVICKYFSGSLTWFVTEINMEKLGEAFGYVKNDSTLGGDEYGYFDLEALSLQTGYLGTPIERDLYFDTGSSIKEYI